MADSSPCSVALVTGSGRDRLGNAVAWELARDGFAIALHYYQSEEHARQTVEKLRGSGHDAEAFQADLTDETQVAEMFQHVARRWQRLDVLVNTAASWESQSLSDVTADDVLRSFRLNTLATFLCARHAGLTMVRQQEGGVIINFGDASITQPYPNHLAYFISKGAIPTMTRALAVELSTMNPHVRVNCIDPGAVMSPPESTDEDDQRRADATLVSFADNPASITKTVQFLIANAFITGECLTVDGGRHLKRVDWEAETSSREL